MHGTGGSGRRLDAGGNCLIGSSFAAGTLVRVENGWRLIEEIAEGDKALGEDPETGEQGYYEVVALTDHPANEILEITIAFSDEEEAAGDSESNEEDNSQTTRAVIQTTADHPIYVEGKGWIWAENLALGDRLRRADGGMARALAIERIELDEPQAVYNFTVKGPHTYFVLSAQILVHNVSCDISLPQKRALVVGDNEKTVLTLRDGGKVEIPSFYYSRLLARQNPDVVVVGTRLGDPKLGIETFSPPAIPNLMVAKNIDARQLKSYIGDIGDSFDFVVFTAPNIPGGRHNYKEAGILVERVLHSSRDVLAPGGSMLFSSSRYMPAGQRLLDFGRQKPPAGFMAHERSLGFLGYTVDDVLFGVKGYIPLKSQGGATRTSLDKMYWFRFQLAP